MIERDMRFLQFDPTRFLAPDHQVRLAKEELLKLHRAEPARRAEVHRLLLARNEEARGLLTAVQENLALEQVHARTAAANRAFFSSRDLPFFYYDLTPLQRAVGAYCAGLEKRSPTASLAEVRS
jgi:hypothetical protein